MSTGTSFPHGLELVDVRVEVVETVRYARTVSMPLAELSRYQSLLADGTDDEAKRDVADLLFSRHVNRLEDECEEDPSRLTVSLTRV